MSSELPTRMSSSISSSSISSSLMSRLIEDKIAKMKFKDEEITETLMERIFNENQILRKRMEADRVPSHFIEFMLEKNSELLIKVFKKQEKKDRKQKLQDERDKKMRDFIGSFDIEETSFGKKKQEEVATGGATAGWWNRVDK